MYQKYTTVAENQSALHNATLNEMLYIIPNYTLELVLLTGIVQADNMNA